MNPNDEDFECLACKACLVDMSGKRKVKHENLELHNAFDIITTIHTVLTQYGIEDAPLFFWKLVPPFFLGGN